MFCTAIPLDWSDCSSASDEVHDDGNHGEEEQQVNEEAAYVQEEEPAKPEQNQQNSQNKKHDDLLSSNGCRAGPRMLQVIGAGTLWIRCSVRKDWCEAGLYSV